MDIIKDKLQNKVFKEEGLKKTNNNKIFIGQQTEVDVEKFSSQLDKLREDAYSNNNEKCVDTLAEIVTTFKRSVVKA